MRETKRDFYTPGAFLLRELTRGGNYTQDYSYSYIYIQFASRIVLGGVVEALNELPE